MIKSDNNIFGPPITPRHPTNLSHVSQKDVFYHEHEAPTDNKIYNRKFNKSFSDTKELFEMTPRRQTMPVRTQRRTGIKPLWSNLNIR